MGTDKFEQHIKSKLQEREILPSATAWDKISSELNTDEVKKKPGYFWMGIAASIVVLIGVTLFYFNGSAAVDEVPNILVETDKEEVLKEEKIAPLENIEEKTQVVTVERGVKNNDNVLKETSHIKTRIQEPVNLEDNVEVAVVSALPLNKSVNEMVISDAVINSKVADIVAQIDVLEQNSTVTDAEVDSLLKRAQDEILRERIFNTDNTVDAMALLTEVEGELDQSFRDQIFNSLKAGFIKVRTAVADRNN